MTNTVLDWTAAADAGPARAGGKGWQLGRLMRLGGPVPPGFVLPAGLSAGHRPGAPLPQAVRGMLAEALAARGWLVRPLAVRSSAPQEDSERASFAGIFQSRLGAQGLDAVAQAVLEVWNSAWSPQAQAYRQRHGLDATDAAMAVIVMPLVPARVSGVAFTTDPVSGRDDQVVIHACRGLGEALVSGQVAGEEYRLEETGPDGGLRLIARPSGAPLLTEAQAVDIAALARDAAAALDYAHVAGYDVEWVWDGERFRIVQARPITARARHTYPALAGQPAYWTRGNTTEVLPEPLSPIEWGLSRVTVNRMLTQGYALSGYRPLPGAQRAGLFRGRLYLEASLIQWDGYDALGIGPEDMNRLLGGRQPAITVPPPTWRESWARRWRLLAYIVHSAAPRRRADATLAEAHRRAAAWTSDALPTDPPALAARLREQMWAFQGADDLFFLQGSGGGSLFNLVGLLEKRFPGEGHALAAALLAGGEPSVTARQAHELMDLARIAEADATALAWLRRPDRGGDWAAGLPADSPFRAAFARFLERYGHRAVLESYLRSPRWREAPDYLLDSALALIGCDPAQLRQRQDEAAAAAWDRMPFWLRPVLRKLVRASIVDSNHREAARSALVASLAALRHCLLDIGRQFLDRPADIFNLVMPEALALAEGRMTAEAAGRRATERRHRLAAWAATPEPDLIVDHGDQIPPPPPAIAADRETWRGTAVGGGRAQGRVRIARSPAEGLPLRPGEVLVAPATDPAWTPLFLKAAALVMQTGGYLSHGAIVAREFGIPAVVNLPGVLEELRDGDMVEVDGARGLVRRIERS